MEDLDLEFVKEIQGGQDPKLFELAKIGLTAESAIDLVFQKEWGDKTLSFPNELFKYVQSFVRAPLFREGLEDKGAVETDHLVLLSDGTDEGATF